MRYVQALGGQVNASTRERATDFFFEVPTNALAGALSACARCWPNRTWASSANAANAK